MSREAIVIVVGFPLAAAEASMYALNRGQHVDTIVKAVQSLTHRVKAVDQADVIDDGE